jgi:hypothetical protein
MTIRNRPAATRLAKGFRRLVSPDFLLQPFELAPLEFEPEELLLDDIVTEYESGSRVAPIFAGAAPGELHARIEQHVEAQAAQQQSRTAADELAAALSELRRSLR